MVFNWVHTFRNNNCIEFSILKFITSVVNPLIFSCNLSLISATLGWLFFIIWIRNNVNCWEYFSFENFSKVLTKLRIYVQIGIFSYRNIEKKCLWKVINCKKLDRFQLEQTFRWILFCIIKGFVRTNSHWPIDILLNLLLCLANSLEDINSMERNRFFFLETLRIVCQTIPFRNW